MGASSQNGTNGKITVKHVKKAVKQMLQTLQAGNRSAFKPKVGDRVPIEFRDPRDRQSSLRQYHQELGIVGEVNELTIAGRAWGGIVLDLFVDEVRSAPVNFPVIIPTEVLYEMREAKYPSAWHRIAKSWEKAKE